jgi:hypothetical protein
MNIHIKIIDHKSQRYNTCGDWWYDSNNDLQIRVSRMSDGRYEQLVALHEQIEAELCDEAGIDEDKVTEFDKQYEADRRPGDVSEPGDSKSAPYYKQHQIATAIEKLLAVELGVNWQDYEREVNGL